MTPDTALEAAIVEGPIYAEMLASIHAASFPEPARWGRDEIATLLGMPGCFACVLGTDGMAMLRVAADEAEVLSLAVRPPARRHGLGSRLLQAAMRECARRGARRLLLESASQNQAARALYRSAGFEAVGQRQAYYEDGDDALVLARDLQDRGSGASSAGGI